MKTVNRWIIATALLVASVTTTAQTNMALTDRQQALAVIAALEAKGDIAALTAALNEGFEKGLTISEAKEALSQLYAYTGFPRSLNALGALQQVINERKAAGQPAEEGREATPLPADYDALKQGTDVQTRLCGGQPFTYAFAPQSDYYLKAHLFGDIFARDNLTFADREVVTVAAISSLPGCEPQLKAHVAGALNMGVTAEALKALSALLEAKVGQAEAERLRGAEAAVFGGSYTPAETVDFSNWPKGNPNDAYAQYFTGNSHLAAIAPANLPEGAATVASYANVTFEPGCRNNWHVHHGAHQILICVAGRGWYQEWGKPAIALRPGMIIDIPADVKHWHGAARDSWFQHLTTHVATGGEQSNEWLEPVTDDIYNNLPQ